MKKTYIQPTIKTVKYSLESHIAGLSGGGGDSFTGTLNSSEEGDGNDVLGKENDIEWDW